MKIPDDILKLFDDESNNITHGVIKLELHLRNGNKRFVIGREHSHYPVKDNDFEKATCKSGRMNQVKRMESINLREGYKRIRIYSPTEVIENDE